MGMHYGNCQSDTARINLTELLPRVVQDLRRCDLVKQENEVLKGYNQALKTMNAATEQRLTATAHDRDRWKGKTKRRGGIIAGTVGVLILETLILIL